MSIVFSVYSFTLSLQPFALSVNEKEVVKNLTDELFHVIPPSNDHTSQILRIQQVGVVR